MRQTTALLNGRPLEIEGDAKQIAFNAVPHIDQFQDNRYTREEMKIVWETQKILGDEKIAINPTAVRIPVFFGHSEAVNIDTESKTSVEESCSLIPDSPRTEPVERTEPAGSPTL